MADVPRQFWCYLWYVARYNSFDIRRAWQGRVAEYLEKYCGFTTEHKYVNAWDA